MPASKNVTQQQLLFVDGTFEELATEMAEYLKAEEARQLLQQGEGKKGAAAFKDEVLSKLVGSSAALTAVPEKEFTAASNMMIHLVLQSSDPKKHLPTLCSTFSKPLASSPVHGAALSLNALTTVFNLLDPSDPVRARVFMEILKFLRAHGLFENLKHYLDRLPEWMDTWGTDAEFQRKLYEEVADVAIDAGEEQ